MCRVRGMPWMSRTRLCGLSGLRLRGSRRGPRGAVAGRGSPGFADRDGSIMDSASWAGACTICGCA